MSNPALPGRRFVDPHQRFVAYFGKQRAWAHYAALIVLAQMVVIGLLIIQNTSLQASLAQRIPIIVAASTAHKLVNLWPDGEGSMTCDDACIDGELEAWVTKFRYISGEKDLEQRRQHEAQNFVASMIATGSAAESVVAQYYTMYSPYRIAATGRTLDVINVHVDLDHVTPGQFVAHWTDRVSDIDHPHNAVTHNFSAIIIAHADSGARNEDQLKYNPGGVVITDIHLSKDQ